MSGAPRRRFNGEIEYVLVCRGCGRPSLTDTAFRPSYRCPHCRRRIVWLKEFGGPSKKWCDDPIVVPAGYLVVASEEPL